MKIVHFSDWHAHMQILPDADLYVCTGDMYDNYPLRASENGWSSWTLDRSHEVKKQTEWANQFVKDGGMRRYMGSPDAPILLVRGNHDFINLDVMFLDCNIVHEFERNETCMFEGLTVTGHRGIPYINGVWSDEVHRPDLKDRVRAMPKADLILTHYPPAGILDGGKTKWGQGIGYGLEGMCEQIVEKIAPYGVHMFGHIHEQGGESFKLDGMTFSNAATSINVIEI